MNMVEVIRQKQFVKGHQNHVSHGFMTRLGGVSTGIYKSLNCGLGSNDETSRVRENIKRARQALGAVHLHQMIQTHSSTCEILPGGHNERERMRADALVTDKAGEGLGVLTADCVPVLFYGEKDDGAPVIGAAHAGWAGAFRGILNNTVRQLQKLGARKKSIIAAIGPCIQQSSYEVGQEFLDRFLSDDRETESFFKSGRAGKFYFDLPGYCMNSLAKSGVEKIYCAGHDTCKDEELFFSYRRATHRNEPDYGRQISCIVII